MPFLIAYLFTVVAANLAVTYIAPSPWFGFGLVAPAGVWFVGLVLVLRDFVHRRYGVKGSLIAVGLGSLISFFMAAPQFVIASVVAFAVAELMDLGVFIPAKARWGMVVGVALSGLVGSVVDSLIFLQLAFHGLDYFWGQLVGKLALTAVAVVFIALHERKHRKEPEQREVLAGVS